MKTLIVYVHLLSTCIAIGTLLIQDWEIFKTRGAPLSEHGVMELKKTARIMLCALIILWVSGIALVLVGYLDNPEKYLTNQKLWGKFTVVCALTLNGILLHYFSFPRVSSKQGILNLNAKEQVIVVVTGVVSTVSWLFASYLGIARPWNFTVDYSFVMLTYLSLLVIAAIVAFEGMLYLLNDYKSTRVSRELLHSRQKT